MTEQLHFHFSLSCIGEGNGNPLRCSCLENPRDGRAWWAAIYGVTQSQTRLKRLSSSSSSICPNVVHFLKLIRSSNGQASTQHLHRACEGCEVSSYWQAKCLACHSFMDAVWLQSQDLSETRTSLYMAQHAGWASGPSQFSSACSSLGPRGRVGWGSGGRCACGFVLRLKIWAWGIYDFQNERALVLGEVLFQSSG